MKTIDILKNLVNRSSISPHDQGCQDFIAEYLQAVGFKIHHLPFENVSNLWARFGDAAPLFVFAGHTDVVPPGNLADWVSPPFTATERDGKLYGRGTADMKGAIAAMLSAVKNFLQNHNTIRGSIAFLITSDEESDALHGTRKVVEWLKNTGELIDYCLVGEATCEATMGDTIKVGRRGSLSGKLKIKGKQGHIAYPHLAENPIHKALPVLLQLTEIEWDKQQIEHFSKTSLQISNLHAGLGATNVIPPDLTLDFNLRYSPATTADKIQNKIVEILTQSGVRHEISFNHSGTPFYSAPNVLATKVASIIEKKLALKPKFSTSGGTSDGRFLCEISSEILEFGVINDSIHKVNEHIDLTDLQILEEIYVQILSSVLH